VTRLDGGRESEIECFDDSRVKDLMNRLFRALFIPAVAVLLPSCYDAGLLYPSGGYSGGSYGSYGYNNSVYRPVGGFGNSGWGGGYGGYGGYGYGSGRVCSRCGYNPCRCSGGGNHHDHDHDSHSGSSSSRSNSSDRQYRIIAGDLDGKKKPNDFHSLDWYHDRGYSLEDVKIETNRGAVIDKRPSSQKSSGHKGSSNSHSKSSSSHSGSSHTKASSSSKKK